MALTVYRVKGLYEIIYASTLPPHDQPVTLVYTQAGQDRLRSIVSRMMSSDTHLHNDVLTGDS